MSQELPQRPLALVTGASSGIGREFARVAAGEDHDVVIVGRRAERLDALAKELSERAVAVTPVVADLTDPAGVPSVVAALGERPVDVLINDAGVGGRGRFALDGVDSRRSSDRRSGQGPNAGRRRDERPRRGAGSTGTRATCWGCCAKGGRRHCRGRRRWGRRSGEVGTVGPAGGAGSEDRVVSTGSGLGPAETRSSP